MFCIGRNHTNSLTHDIAVSKRKDGGYQVFGGTSAISDHAAEQIFAKSPRKRFSIDGGPSCFGDSGGPLFRLMEDQDKNGGSPVVPVQIGVFSFILWGTCQGVAEPGYYGRVKLFREWIKKYVPEEEICWYSKNKGIVPPKVTK